MQLLSIAEWRINKNHGIFLVSLFDTRHKMLHGYELESSCTFENWMVEELNERFMQISVDKIFEM
ncbi:hypothetical protein [Catalinimonas niigatensis]|uniref:hypothetical protein n=1 Tax=Catalinimonas niigatensis TaxID=1397264 RepID=UPI002665CBE7|nr:hypothetical protein [Catalinimonas niigatensis]WPP48741.1 hypothetical protein PZB72_18920 [Catalinimonas niigatensis]